MNFFHDRFYSKDPDFSPKPMWFLNGDLNEDEITRQLTDFLNHGVRGVILHPRIGIPKTIEYLGDRFMSLIRHAVAECERLGMQVILYDEGMYPSGSACGQVVKQNPAYASRCIRLSMGTYELKTGEDVLAHFAITGDAHGYTASRRLPLDQPAEAEETDAWLITGFSGGTIRGIHDDQDDGLQDAPPAADILNAEAVRCFIHLTHDKYAEWVGQWFGSTIVSVFCDEPGPLGRNVPSDLREWTPGMENELHRAGLSLEDLPALWLDFGSRSPVIRKAFDLLIQQLLGDSLYAQLSDWCHAHHLNLTGHPAHADDIGVEKYFDIPGQDVVWRWVAPENGLALHGRESTQAICASSSAMHRGKRRNSCECFGCCGKDGNQWAFSIEDMLFYLNWLFVRGCNCLYPHAFLYAADTRVRFGDRPPDVGPNNYWWPWYNQIAEYMTRGCALLTDVEPGLDIAILVSEAYLPDGLAAELFQRQVEFSYLEASLLKSASIQDGRIHVGSQAYRILALEEETGDEDIHEIISRFVHQGGTVIYVHKNGVSEAADRIAQLLPDRVQIAGDRKEDIRILTRYRDGIMLIMVSNEGEEAWQGEIRLPHPGYCECLDPWKGQITVQPLRGNAIPVRLGYREALFFTVDVSNSPVEISEEMPAQRIQDIPLDTVWSAHWDQHHLENAPLGDWQKWPGMARFSGSVTWETKVTLSVCPEKAEIDLGEIHEIAVIQVNDRAPVPILRRPHTCDISEFLHKGENTIAVKIISNRVSYFDDRPSPAGLFGPVMLRIQTAAGIEN